MAEPFKNRHEEWMKSQKKQEKPPEKPVLKITPDSAMEMLKAVKHLQLKMIENGPSVQEGIFNESEELRFKKGIDTIKAIENNLKEQGYNVKKINW